MPSRSFLPHPTAAITRRSMPQNNMIHCLPVWSLEELEAVRQSKLMFGKLSQAVLEAYVFFYLCVFVVCVSEFMYRICAFSRRYEVIGGLPRNLLTENSFRSQESRIQAAFSQVLLKNTVIWLSSLALFAGPLERHGNGCDLWPKRYRRFLRGSSRSRSLHARAL